MKKKNIIDQISLKKGLNEKNLPDKKDVITDDAIIAQIQQIEDLEQRDRDGRTLLINAAFYCRPKVVEYLIKKQADINAKDNYGNSPLAKTMLNTPIEIFQILLNYGANPNEKNNFGCSVIDIFQACPEILSILKAQ